jgi:predicted ArsR family transcriptional regulator
LHKSLLEYNSAVKTTRQRIVEYLQSKRHGSAAELSLALQVTPANIRHHLSVLAGEGVVEVIAQHAPRSQRGRPVHVYALSKQSAEHNLESLASALLRCSLSEGQDHSPPLRRLAQEICGSAIKSSGSQTQKLTQAVAKLNEMHYQARWEAHASGPRLILAHCPYLSILDQHPELCTMDAYILEEMLGMEARLLLRREPNRLGLPQCVFSLSAQKAKPKS